MKRDVGICALDASNMRTVIDLGNAIRSALRLFGFNMPAGPGSGGARAFERRVEQHLAEQPGLVSVVLPLLEAWRAARKQVAQHESSIRAEVRSDERCQLLMTVPGVGHLNAVAFVAAIGDTKAFPSGRTAAAWIGLTPRRYQSGEINMQGRISRHGDKLLRSYLYEAAAHILTRAKTDSALKRWGTALREKVGFKRANVAVAGKLAVTLFAMLRTGKPFEADGVAA
ncbi:IS110 family transposase [Epibacterium mobile]|nr:IS110 family transposase [Tritonibacter mobilis]NHM22761.1 IS110 family transposase [Tritonibacter mobilis]